LKRGERGALGKRSGGVAQLLRRVRLEEGDGADVRVWAVSFWKRRRSGGAGPRTVAAPRIGNRPAVCCCDSGQKKKIAGLSRKREKGKGV
jgi:hypothetical protein